MALQRIHTEGADHGPRNFMDPRLESAGVRSLSPKSAASWPAIIAGAFVAAAASLLLISLGSGIGFAAISPWPARGISVTTFAMTTARSG